MSSINLYSKAAPGIKGGPLFLKSLYQTGYMPGFQFERKETVNIGMAYMHKGDGCDCLLHGAEIEKSLVTPAMEYTALIPCIFTCWPIASWGVQPIHLDLACVSLITNFRDH